MFTQRLYIIMIKCICSYFNYYEDELRKQNYIKFRKNFAHDLLTVEVAKDESEFFIDDAIQIIAKPENLLWQKERCFNIALESLPPSVDKIVWVDTDIIFHNKNWLDDLETQLDNYAFVQPFERVVEINNHYNHNLNCFGYGKLVYDKIQDGSTLPASIAQGLSWGVNRSILKNGFYDKHILGSNDALQLISWLGDVFNIILLQLPHSLIMDFLDYYNDMDHFLGSNMNYCKGVVEHMYHGDTFKRGYNAREKLFRENFEIDDLEIDNNGLYKLNNNKKLLEITNHFSNLPTHT